MSIYAEVSAIATAAAPIGVFATVEAEPNFAKLVRSASFILTENNPFSYAKIARVSPQCYWDAFIYLASQRKARVIAAQGTEVNIGDYAHLYAAEEVVEMLRPDEGALTSSTSSQPERYNAYGPGIQWYVAKLVAAHLIRNIPLNNSLKQVDIADNLEEQAYKGLQRIIDISDLNSGSTTTGTTTKESNQGQVTFYIAHDLDKTTIPESAFNTADPGSNPATYTGPVNLGDSVNTVNGIIVPADKTAFCYFYMTGQAYGADKDVVLSAADSTNSRSVSFKIEDIFDIANGTNIDELIMLIADAINSKALTEVSSISSLNDYVGNILVAPQRGTDQIKKLSAVKKLYYPNTTELKFRKALFEICVRYNKLSFDTRRLSSKTNTELLTISFYTTDTVIWNSYLNKSISIEQLRKDSSTNFGIEGLIFGQQNSFDSLNKTSPVSLLLNVTKGNVIPVSIQSGGSSSTANTQFAQSGDLDKTDTFYFSVEDNFTSFSSNSLIFRVSSTNYLAEAPVLISVDLTTVDVSDIGLIGEQVALKLVEAIYQFTRNSHFNTDSNDNTNVLGVLLGEYQYEYLNINKDAGTVQALDLTPENNPKDSRAGRVQIVGFRYKKEEFKIVVDIITLPSELTVATGNYLARKTLWVRGRARSISVETKALNTGTSANGVETNAETLASVNASVSKAEASISPLLQKVYDKQRLLKENDRNYLGVDRRI